MDEQQPYSVEALSRELEASLEGLRWVLGQVPESLERYSPHWAGAVEPGWSVAQNLAHLAVYEERLAAPVLGALAAGGDGVGAVESGGEDWLATGARELSVEPVDAILERLEHARARQVEAVRSFDDEGLNRPATPLWRRPGAALDSAGWVAAKTVQHTWEHGTTIFQIALFAPR